MIYTTFTLIILYGIGNYWDSPTRIEIPAIATEQACNNLGRSMLPGYENRGGGAKFWCVPVTKPVPQLGSHP